MAISIRHSDEPPSEKTANIFAQCRNIPVRDLQVFIGIPSLWQALHFALR
jgi:hypothetical protein